MILSRQLTALATKILKALVLTGERDENPVLQATRRIGRLVEIVEGVAAAAESQGRAEKAAIEVAGVGKWQCGRQSW